MQSHTIIFTLRDRRVDSTVAQLEKIPSGNPDNLSSNPIHYMVEGENQLYTPYEPLPNTFFF